MQYVHGCNLELSSAEYSALLLPEDKYAALQTPSPPQSQSLPATFAADAQQPRPLDPQLEQWPPLLGSSAPQVRDSPTIGIYQPQRQFSLPETQSAMQARSPNPYQPQLTGMPSWTAADQSQMNAVSQRQYHSPQHSPEAAAGLLPSSSGSYRFAPDAGPSLDEFAVLQHEAKANLANPFFASCGAEFPASFPRRAESDPMAGRFHAQANAQSSMLGPYGSAPARAGSQTTAATSNVFPQDSAQLQQWREQLSQHGLDAAHFTFDVSHAYHNLQQSNQQMGPGMLYAPLEGHVVSSNPTQPPQGYAQQPQDYPQQPQGLMQQPQGHLQQPRGYAPQPQGQAQQPQGYTQQSQGHMQDPQGYAQQQQASVQQHQGYSQHAQHLQSLALDPAFMLEQLAGREGTHSPARPYGHSYTMPARTLAKKTSLNERGRPCLCL